jgi:hypothetical protein
MADFDDNQVVDPEDDPIETGPIPTADGDMPAPEPASLTSSDNDAVAVEETPLPIIEMDLPIDDDPAL